MNLQLAGRPPSLPAAVVNSGVPEPWKCEGYLCLGIECVNDDGIDMS